MSTDNPADFTQAELLYHYLGERIAKGERDAPVQNLLDDFQQYCQELDKLRSMIREAEESSARGESGPLDVEDVIRRGRERAAREGITD